MGFLDKARAAANDLAAKADETLASSGLGGPGGPTARGEADRYLRDLGALAFLEAEGRPASGEERDRVLTALREMQAKGSLDLTLRTAAPAATAPPPPAATTPPPPGATPPAGPPQRLMTPPPPTAPPVASPPPPPPSWLGKDD